MGLIDLQRQILSLCFDETPSEASLSALGQREAWLTYREMIRERLLRELRLALPRTRTLVGDSAFEATFVQQLEREPPRARYFRQVVSEFVAYASPLWAADAQLPPASRDLARYELAHWEVRDLVALPELPLDEFSFERVAVVSRALRLLALDHAVRPGEGLEARREFLCIQRAPDSARTKVWRLTPTTFQLLERLVLEDICVSDVVKQTAQASGARIDAPYLDGLCGTLAQFLEVGIILGSR
jgi:hypothetical protein